MATNFPATNSDVIYYWVDGTSNETVQVSATVNGMTNTAQSTFNILRPTATVTSITGTVALDYMPPPNQTVPWLHFGIPGTGQTHGIQLTNSSLIMPSGYYNGGSLSEDGCLLCWPTQSRPVKPDQG